MRDKLRRPMAMAALSLFLAAPIGGCQAPVPEQFDHGVVWLRLARGDSQQDNPYVGTTRIEVSLLYLECLSAFYQRQPEYQQFGPEGALVFGTREEGGEGWFDRLCDLGDPASIDCTVESFRQEFDLSRQLTVTYAVEGDPENLEVPFGPIPKASLAACEAGGQPVVRVGSNGAVRGLDGNGDTIWNTESFNPAEAATDQGGRIVISAARDTK